MSDDSDSLGRRGRQLLTFTAVVALAASWLWSNQGDVLLHDEYATALRAISVLAFTVRIGVDLGPWLRPRVERAAVESRAAIGRVERPSKRTIGTVALAGFIMVSAFLPYLGIIGTTPVSAASGSVVEDFEDSQGISLGTLELQSSVVREGSQALKYTDGGSASTASVSVSGSPTEISFYAKVGTKSNQGQHVVFKEGSNTAGSIEFYNDAAVAAPNVANDSVADISTWTRISVTFDYQADTYSVGGNTYDFPDGDLTGVDTIEFSEYDGVYYVDYVTKDGAGAPVTVSGTVEASGGSVLENATVTATDSNGNQIASATTDANGDYSFSATDGASLTINATKSQYETVSKSVTVNGDTTTNFVLQTIDPTLQVNVSNEEGNNVGAATTVVYDSSAQNTVVASSFTDGTGTAAFEIGTGTYTVVVRKQHHVTATRDGVSVTTGSLQQIDMLLAREGEFEAGLYNGTVDPVNGTLNGTNYSVTEYDCAQESNLVDDGIQYLTGSFSNDPGADAPSCEALRTSQEQIDAFSHAVATNRSEQYSFVFLSNRLRDARSIAYTKGKIAAVDALNRGANKSVAREEAREAIGNYYARIQKNLYARWTESAAQAVYIDDAMEEADEGDWIKVEGGGTSDGVDDLEPATVELVNGSSTSIKTLQSANGNIIVPIAANASSTSGSATEGRFVRVYAPNDTADTQIVHGPEFQDILGNLRDQDDQVKANVQTLVNNIYDEYSQDEINATDLVDPVELAGQASSDYNSTGFYGFAAAQLSALGYEGNVSSVQTIEVDYGSRTETHTGTLYYTGDDLSAFTVGDRYDPADLNGTFFMATSTNGTLEINSPFVITEQTDRTTGEQVNSVTLEQDDYATADTTSWLDFLDRLDNVERAQNNFSTTSIGGGGGLGDLFGGGSLPTAVIIGLVALLLLSLLGG